MAHWSEEARRLRCMPLEVRSLSEFGDLAHDKPAMYLFRLPFPRTQADGKRSKAQFEELAKTCANFDEQSTICFLTTPEDAAILLAPISNVLKFHHWVAVKTTPNAYAQQAGELTRRHAALLIFTRYDAPLVHTKTRIKYSYCPACDRTTKDYGGKAQMYHKYGTSISDVWRDVEWDPSQGVEIVVDRLRDLFGVKPYRDLHLIDLNECPDLAPKRTPKVPEVSYRLPSRKKTNQTKRMRSRLVHGDCLDTLRSIPNNSMDFCFADLPYNLKKKYCRWKDDLEIVEYLRWCDEWLAELFRVLKPEGTLAVLNMPLLSARHFEYLSSVMTFRNWIVWEALSLPVRKIMPAHYAILCFSKGLASALPGLVITQTNEEQYIEPLEEGFCIRPTCYLRRPLLNINDRGTLTDIWHDIHRLKHNARRVNHPCQLPPLLMRRLFALFTEPGDMILDCFDAAGTSTLVAAEMGRRYIGIEQSKRYHNLARKRHMQLREGNDPFDKGKKTPTAKNNRIRRMPFQKYAVTKKDLQLDVKRIYQQIGRLPTRDDVAKHSPHPISYFKKYFANWGEVCAAARTTGMSETLSMN